MPESHNYLIDQVKRIGKDLIDIISKATDEIWTYKPLVDYQTFSDFFLHALRSYEYYTRGIATDKWEFLKYGIDSKPDLSEAKILVSEVNSRVEANLDSMTQKTLENKYTQFNQPTTALNLLIEVIEHAAHHIGQLTIYLRLNGIKPPTIQYII